MSTNPTTRQRAILFDLTRCGGCNKCVDACLAKQGFPGKAEDVKDLSATAYTVVKQVEDPDGEEWNYREMCRHCVEPSCASVCPVAAIYKTDLGPVVYEASKCMGCRYCMQACPFNVPRYEWDNPVPAVRKCDMCYDRQKEGKPTACAEACPNEATVCGWRDELLEEAHRRIEEDPDEYHDHVYGETEIGGTSVLFLSPFPIEELGFNAELGTTPMPAHTWQVLSKIPTIAVTAGATMCAMWWLTQRRDEVRAYEAAQKRAKTTGRSGNHGTEGNGRG